MTFGQLTWEIFFSKNHTQNVVEKLVPNPFLKIKSEHVSRSTVWNFIQFLLIQRSSRRLTKCNETKMLTTCFYFIESSKKMSGTILPASFSHDIWRKIFLTLYSINWTNFIVWLPLVLVILANVIIMCYNYFFSGLTS